MRRLGEIADRSSTHLLICNFEDFAWDPDVCANLDTDPVALQHQYAVSGRTHSARDRKPRCVPHAVQASDIEAR